LDWNYNPEQAVLMRLFGKQLNCDPTQTGFSSFVTSYVLIYSDNSLICILGFGKALIVLFFYSGQLLSKKVPPVDSILTLTLVSRQCQTSILLYLGVSSAASAI
jgi:hypothetical protein